MTRTTHRSRPTSARLKRLKLIHLARRELDLDEQRYRDLLLEATGNDSCRELTLDELDDVLASLRLLGWAPKPPRRRYSPASAHKQVSDKTPADKIRAMWIGLHQAGLVRDPSEAALAKFVKRLTGKYTADWLNTHEATIVIEALKAWAMREHCWDAKRGQVVAA